MDIEETKTRVDGTYGFAQLKKQALDAVRSRESDEVRRVILERAETFAVTRSHHYSLACQWLDFAPDRAAMHIDRLAETRSHCPRLESFNPFSPDVASVVQLYLRSGRVAAALDSMRRAEQDASTCHDWVRCADLWATADRIDEARRCLSRAFELDAECWNHLDAADVLMRIGDVDGARTRFEALLESMDSTYELVTAARRCLMCGQVDVSQRFLDAATRVAIEPQDHIDCGELAVELGQSAAARALLAGVELELWDYHNRGQVAAVLQKLGDHEAAAACIQAMVETCTDSYELISIARAFMNIERHDLVAQSLDRVLSMDADRSWFDCASLAMDIGDHSRARKALPRATEMIELPEEVFDCAGWWKAIGDEGRFRALMERALEAAETTDDWLRLAEKAAEYGRPEWIAHAFHSAEECADSHVSWLECADTQADYGDRDAALRCLRAAEATADRVMDRCRCADRWGALVGRDEALDCLTRAEPLVDGAYEWIDLAVSSHHLDAGEATTRRMQRATACAGESYERLHCVTTYLAMGDRSAAQSLIAELREAASSAGDWLEIAGTKLLDEATVAEATRQAEAAAASTYELVRCAEAHERRHERSAVRRCLDRGTELAGSIGDWLSVAATWHDIDEPGLVAECAGHAARLADSIADTIDIAEHLIPIDPGLALAQLELAEEQVSDTLRDLLHLAVAWHSFEFEYVIESARSTLCIERAVPLASDCADHLALGAAMARLQLDRAAEYLEIAESLARTADEWNQCAYEWDDSFGDDAAAERCRRQADSAPDSG